MTIESPRTSSPPEQRDRRRPSNAVILIAGIAAGGAIIRNPEAAAKALPYTTMGAYALAIGCIVLPILSRKRR